MGENYLTMNINEFEELPFSFEGSLEGQADPMPFFRQAFGAFVGEGEEVLVIHPRSEMRKAMIHAMKQLGAEVYDAEPTDSYNYMLDVIHRRHIELGGSTGGAASETDSARSGTAGDALGDAANGDAVNGGGMQVSVKADTINRAGNVCNIDLIAGSAEALRGLLKHSAEIATAKILITDRFAAPALISDLKAAWGCEVFIHYTRPELAGLGAIGPESENEFAEELEGGMEVSRELYIEIIDPETGLPQPEGKWGEIVVTSIFPAKYPLVRYRTGDISRYIDTHKLDRIKNQTEGIF